jgi:uncharacterized protein YbaP (TraB family)
MTIWRALEAGWKSGRHAQVCDSLTAFGRISPTEHAVLDAAVIHRNSGMADMIERHSKTFSVVAVAGMAHFCGERSLLVELGRMGFSIEEQLGNL